MLYTAARYLAKMATAMMQCRLLDPRERLLMAIKLLLQAKSVSTSELTPSLRGCLLAAGCPSKVALVSFPFHLWCETVCFQRILSDIVEQTKQNGGVVMVRSRRKRKVETAATTFGEKRIIIR